jgi:hypothetical protein
VDARLQRALALVVFLAMMTHDVHEMLRGVSGIR